MTDPRYPIGKFEAPRSISAQDRAGLIDNVATAPARLRTAVRGLSDKELDTPYRDGGWTVRQVIHHVPESHMNAYIRFKLALTEQDPVIKPYDEAAWARLPDNAGASIESSLRLLEHLHERWVVLMRAMEEEAWKRRYIHPEQGRAVPLEEVLALYSWHGDHHIAHVTRP
jgi:uncharacterized damage-inducible protein DinB